MVDQIRFFAGAARVLEGRSAGEYMAGHTSYVRREPIGVCAQVTPWNYPMMMAVWKFAPALAAGNTVVLKPSDTTPVSTLLLAEIAAEFLPPGVLNVVCGDRDTGRALVSAPHAAAGLDHRLDPGRPRGRRAAAHRPQADPPRARRQGAGHRLRRRRRRGGRRGDRGRRVLQRRTGLHRGHPGAGRPRHPRRLRRGADRAGPRHPDRRSRRRRCSLRTVEQRQPARPGSPGSSTGCPTTRRCRPAASGSASRGYFYAPTVVDGLRQERRDHPGRGVRAGHHRAALRRRGRGGALGQRRASTAWPPRCGPATTAGRCGCPGGSTSAASGSTPTSRSWPRCRTAGSSSPGTARTCPCTAWRTTPGSSTSCTLPSET